MKKLFSTLVMFLLLTPTLFADEGMWLLPYLQKLNASKMVERGLKLNIEDIYSADKSSLKDAIVIFGGGCTGEIISSEGLVLTNHHCGYGAIQQHSSVENDYLKNGFWAMSRAEEIPTPGLSVTFIKSIEDVTSLIIPKLKDNMTESERRDKIAELIKKIENSTKLKEIGTTASVQSFFGGNQYILIVKQVYNDVRMVGAPPTSIGKFGGDTDNWMWPRHTGDFSLFRIYASKDGSPAEYSKDNIPLTPKKHLTISLAGVKEGDFTMIMGFPGSTQRYMTSFEIDETLNQNNPNRIKIRGLRQEVLLNDMKADPKIQIQYASKYAGSSNYWKNSIGMNRGLTKLNVKADKLALEEHFTEWVNSGDDARKAKYGDALTLINNAVSGRMPYTNVNQYISESLMRGIELISLTSRFDGYLAQLKLKEAGKPNNFETVSQQTLKNVTEFYKDYSPSTDRKVAKVMVKTFLNDVDKNDYPTIFEQAKTASSSEIDAAIDNIYNSSIFASESALYNFMNNPSSVTIENDDAYCAYRSIKNKSNEMSALAEKFNDMYSRGHRKFVDGIINMDKDKSLYPDANFTIRLTYGNVLPYKPMDAVTYDYFTTLTGVIEKEDPLNQYEFSVPEKLKELYKAKDFGQYGQNNDVVVGFISNNDITGGNSGSPILNDKGELVGTAFDGNWEAMSGDIAFETNLQRCISVDIRYTLFIIDKFAGATHLIDEMTIVK